ncbi:rod shape-determining protein RodA [Candidatus Azambacteria bacterium RIFCSPHIGHO2_01_FULL_44_55]|uniref:Rod shape-determining protein RodA n=1 Tax=Candidatus Azambacteria bacterium RIFCSPLOWO2_02_FULL_44_14 TaxID=1797306 RepID=A0A1F5CAQ2_9BACT|nr:MAG: rod shape-determining protein RodA [Candidatus Azambacteria bacterium RIFCSPLOWO2_01_FULL_44_84]OGD33482.1 MAG: rod shape-determining protein RodA [Candidatus Azambacteria bacterium RIFCSPHIGHO2_02_FULL_45_18]OGD39956.1 MAG: rod shape-determining protein RodA [Candidatus Azambacteria bacterium RIFCSPLOWO2_02_FULL_44_14]OGD40941.1 MAG: rod shape-determining protein RodA [Candidatus Azambacteria bacterium RIFCSPHIGHO2_01_FULL_44_55]OGD52386.1 MAG: rod shape-determining protein RodA [Candi
MSEILKKSDWILIGAIALLLIISLLSIASVSQNKTSFLTNFNKQLIFVFLGACIFFILSVLDYRILRNYSSVVLVIYFLSVILLAVLLFVGTSTRGAVSWFRIGAFNFEPSELVKFILIATLAKYFSSRHIEFGLFRHIIISGIYTLIPVTLLVLQPDLGGAILILAVWVGMMFFAGIRARHLLALFLIFTVVSGVSWQFILKDYQRARIFTFFEPQSDPLGRGYNVTQSIIAVGSGGVFGKGLGHGTQSQLNFLPERHTDFIFATIAEEWGFMGIIFVFLLWGTIFWRLAMIGSNSSNNFARLFVWGFWLLLLGHFTINVGMNMGLMPITGIPLSMISYGGSSLVTTFLSFGIINNIRINSV